MLHFQRKLGGHSIFLLLGTVLASLSCKEASEILPTLDASTFYFKELAESQLEIKGHDLLIKVPSGTNLHSLTPSFSVEEGVKVVPSLGGDFDFSNPVFFTLIHPSGGKTVYSIVVEWLDAPAPLILGFGADEVTAGESFSLLGEHFGLHNPDIHVVLFNHDVLTGALDHNLVDSQTLEVTVPDTLQTGEYSLSLSVRDNQVVSSSKIRIRYPHPAIDKLFFENYLQGDTLFFKGNFVNTSLFHFYMEFLNAVNKSALSVQHANEKEEQFVVIPKDFKTGQYQVALFNASEKTRSGVWPESIRIYDRERPFVKELAKVQHVVKPNAWVHFSTINFIEEEYRFYQVSLKGAGGVFVQNGIFNSEEKKLSVKIPEDIPLGDYAVSMELVKTDLEHTYSFETNIRLSIR
ncbi:hypothetical protein LAG90_08680 [Marinilongibacter aquaticus]|uniref:hypothetical protein n=1 Tax=Marinilongibacter aquaticus TaxID=2975157 RepID=UPI0021BCFD3F|nr:hypothetical protein [Marinilongibacter aquaticus]UBM60709.1 hypothetical protein LAG90_08680 [Marinilongibacter aquaticus]